MSAIAEYVAVLIQRIRSLPRYIQGTRIKRLGVYTPPVVLAFAILLLPAGSTLLSSAESSQTVPVFKITGVVRDDSVSIRTANFPANKEFTATMGPMGTQGINGTVVGSVNSGSGGTFDATFKIPANLQGSYQISVRLQTPGAFPYYSYNWFYNNTTGAATPPPESPEVTPPPPGYSGIPTFSIVAVEKDTTVTFQTNNFPPNQTFNVTMGLYGTRGIGGIQVGTLDSASGGSTVTTYEIPAELRGQSRIAIRAQTSHSNPYFAYNWFYNNDANVATAGTGGAEGAGSGTGTEGAAPVTGYAGIPVISITSVEANKSVTFQTQNYPPNQVFSVTMGPMGTRGIGGYGVGTFNSGQGGSFPVMVPIAPELAGSAQISIRAQTSHAAPFYSYNWFYNNTTP